MYQSLSSAPSGKGNMKYPTSVLPPPPISNLLLDVTPLLPTSELGEGFVQLRPWQPKARGEERGLACRAFNFQPQKRNNYSWDGSEVRSVLWVIFFCLLWGLNMAGEEGSRRHRGGSRRAKQGGEEGREE